ncbi:metallophosphoesterase [Niallia sp. XMNu-256]|uniref:metallophosphoesterase family protein n=1 Tax=Niallia sp. XMNu-256 TaxID=3082444 RepID=UPI0030D0B515
MKVLIVSDSHGLTSELEKIYEKHQNEVQLFIHCGDSELEPDHPAMKNYVVVGGNCDFDERLLEEILENVGNKTIFITHGHKYSVKSNLMNIAYKAKEVGANIVCFGHSHYLGAEMDRGILFINPGSIRLPRGRIEKTYVILDMGEKEYQLHIFDLEKGELPGLTQTFLYQE